LNRRLGIYFDEQGAELEESEPFVMDNLQLYHLKDELLDSYLNKNDFIEENLLAEGQLPHGHFSTLLLDQHSDSIKSLAESLTDQLAEESDIEITLQVNKVKLQGWIKGVYRDFPIRYRPGKANTKFKLQCFIEFLNYCAVVDNPKPMLMFCEDGALQFSPLSRASALKTLALYIDLYLQGMKEPLPFFVRSSGAYMAKVSDNEFKAHSSDKELTQSDRDKNASNEQKALVDTFNDSYNRVGEGSDAYIQRCFPELSTELIDQIIDLADRILMPMQNQLGEHVE